MYLSNSNQEIWVSDLIGNDYMRWNNEFVALDCGTGSGKSYFCIRILGNYAKKRHKKILYLCNRGKLRKQVYDEARRLGLLRVIYVTSYQTIQRDIQDGKQLPYYDYIVADECHYFTTDAKFNEYTDISYDFLMKQKNSVVLWVSATAKIFFKWLADMGKIKRKNIYKIDKNYSYVKQVYFYQREELSTIIDDILENEPQSKIVVFCNSASRMKEMHKYYGEMAHYFCSNTSSNMELKRICGYDNRTEKVKDCIKKFPNGKVTFEKRILFTTTVLDNGVDLKDKNIKHIFSEIFDVDSMIQSLGRKRSMAEDDQCTFYIREFQPNEIQGLLNINKAQLEPVRLYLCNYNDFYNVYGKGKKRKQLSKNQIFYSYFAEDKHLSKIRVNMCKYRKYKRDNTIMSRMKESGYIPILSHFLGKELSSRSEYIVVDVKRIDLFMEYLKSIEGKRLYKEDRQRIKGEFERIGVKLRYIGINTFNGALDDIYNKLYLCRFYNKDKNKRMLVDKERKLDDGSENPNRNKTYWILENRN